MTLELSVSQFLANAELTSAIDRVPQTNSFNMNIQFFTKRAQAVHAFVARSKTAFDGIKAQLDCRDPEQQARAAEFYMRLTALIQQIRYASTSLGLSFEELQLLSHEQLNRKLKESAGSLVQKLHEHTYKQWLQDELAGSTFETIDAGYKQAVIEVHAQIERTFWTIEAFARGRS